MINVITVYEKITDLKHLHIDTSQIWITFYHFQNMMLYYYHNNLIKSLISKESNIQLPII